MNWTQIILNVSEETMQPVSDMLYGIGIESIEIVDSHISKEEVEGLFIDYIDEELLNNDDVKIKCYISDVEPLDNILDSINKSLKELMTFVDTSGITVSTFQTKDENWENSWKQYYKPFKVGDDVVVTPIWENETLSKDGDIVIRIDPGMAFGSGTHETTSMCIKLLRKYIDQDTEVLDVGCGSGILGIAAAKLGARHIIGIDLDKNAVKIAKENIEHNELSNNIDIKHGDLVENIYMKADVVVANILAHVIIQLTDDIKSIIKEDGIYISSGIILDKVEEVTNKLADSGFQVIEVLRDGEWAAIVATLRSE